MIEPDDKEDTPVATRLSPIDAGAWNERHARHLMNRAGFGVPHSAIPTLVEAGPSAAVDLFVNYERFADNAPSTDFVTPRSEDEFSKVDASKLDEEERRQLQNQRQRRERAEIDELKVWWLKQMLHSSRPLQEKMALFWHGHFATSARQVTQPEHNLGILNVFREYATASFRTMVFAVGKTPAMLTYLNNKQNRKGRPNENWARELMELFTIGIGAYTEQDIREAARAFTGYTERNGEFQFVSSQHDFGAKTFLGRTGNLDGADIINIIFEQPETARFISRKLWEYFAYEEPDAELVEEMAAILRANNYELKPLLRAMFLSREFHGEKAMAGQVKSPAQYIVMLCHDLGIDEPPASLVTLAMTGLGQNLFYPPNVKGWPGNRAWIDTNTLMLRQNIPAYTVLGERSPRGRVMELDDQGPQSGGQNEPRRSSSSPRAMDVSRYFAPFYGQTPEQVVASVANRLLIRPLDVEQCREIGAILASNARATAPFRQEHFRNASAAAALHLILCTAEYQLC